MRHNTSSIQIEKYQTFRAGYILPPDIAFDLAKSVTKSLAEYRNARSKFDRIGEKDKGEEKQATWAREWAGKYADKAETETAQIAALTRVEVEEEYQN